MAKKAVKQTSTKPEKLSEKELIDKMKLYIRSRGSDHLKDGNISSLGIGYKMKGGRVTNELAIQFTVGSKVSPENLKDIATTPIPSKIDIGGIEVATDVIERSFKVEYYLVPEQAANDRKTRIDPIVPGVSLANFRETAGTFGCLVYDKKTGAPHILSNWHVLHGPDGQIGDDITQPGPHDDNRIQKNKVGKLVRSHLGHAGDCAIASITERAAKSDVHELGVTPTRLGDPELGDKVIKSGRTTAVTHGMVTRVHTIAKLNYGGSVGLTEVGGFEIGPDPKHLPADGEVSKGGDSGSVWMFKDAKGKTTDIIAGLHFAGEGEGDPNEHAIACYIKSVFEKLEVSLAQPKVSQATAATGYDEDFLGVTVEVPVAPSTSTSRRRKQQDVRADHTHFSVAMNPARKLPAWVAWNIDGGTLHKLSRKGLKFVLDPKLDKTIQVGDELYEGNRLDRGHIARRADLCWGELGEAKRANKESFFFSNICPQMDNFNQGAKSGIWGQLEDAVFEDTEVEALKVSVFGGPIFGDDDMVFRDVAIPSEYWKIIIFVEASVLKAKAFLLTQKLDELEALELDEFKVYQVSLKELADRSGLKFSKTLLDADRFTQPESLKQLKATRKPIMSPQAIDWS